MIMYSTPLMKKKFAGETFKEARKKALQWIGKNIMCKDELSDISYSFKEEIIDQFPTVTLMLSVSLDEKTVMERHCAVCKEFHQHFYINENCNCTECKAMAYKKRMEEMIKPKKQCFKEKLKETLRQSKKEQA